MRFSLFNSRWAMSLGLSVCLCFSAPSFLPAADASPADILKAGAVKFKEEGISSALLTWMKKTKAESDLTIDLEMTTTFNSIQNAIGPFQRLELIQTLSIAPSLTVVYGLMVFETGLLACRWDFMRPGEEWLMMDFDYNSNLREIFPPLVIAGKSNVTCESACCPCSPTSAPSSGTSE
jgi:hypothetical protein